MSYIKTNWQDLPNQTIPVNADNLNHIEQGIYDNDQAIATKATLSDIEDNLVNVSNEVDEDYRVNFVKSKNLFDGILEDGSISNTTGENTNIANRKRTANYIPVKPNTIYTLSYQISASLIVLEYNANKGFIQAQPQTDWHTSPYTFTTSASTKYIRFIADTSNLTTAMLNEGSTALPYESYVVPSIVVDNEEIYNQNIMNYSTNEIRIGTWIDGKPLYRKVVNFTILVDNSNYASYTGIASLIQNIDKMITCKYWVESGTLLIPCPNIGQYYSTLYIQRSWGGIVIVVDSNSKSNFNGKTATVILEYTKTTD